MSYRTQIVQLSVVALLIMSACEREPKIAVDRQGVGAAHAVAFKGQTYRTRNGRSAITLVSSEELEYTDGGTILLCKYSQQNGALRVIMTALGTQQVLYFRRVNGGLHSNDGKLFYDQAGLAELQRQEDLARRQEEEARVTAERERAEAERLAALEAQRQMEARQAAEEQARREAPEKLRRLLSGKPALTGTYMTGFGGAKVTMRVASFDSGSGVIAAEADFPATGYNSAHSNRAEGKVTGDTLSITFFDSEKPDKPWKRMELRYDGMAGKLVGQWFNPRSDRGSEVTFDLQ